MLSKEDNEFFTRIGPGTLMGDLIRQYWLPAVLSAELASPDCPPLRLRLLGEDLVAFRDSEGRVGLVSNFCVHRGASLYFGRNEQGGIRCVYHGWKYDVSGSCIDMPNEPPESNFKDKIRIAAYPCRERNGLIWAYMGPLNPAPELPDFEFNLVPETHSYTSKRWQYCNWTQALEGGLDSSHVAFLHSRFNASDKELTPEERLDKWRSMDRWQRFEVVDTDFGIYVGKVSPYDAERDSWGITPFMMPFWKWLPRGPRPQRTAPPVSTSESTRGSMGGSLISGHAWVPIDDENTMCWSISYHPLRALEEEEIHDHRR
ncbi:MAG: Rieske 2Fe-2S domain-containing protein, partial [Dehalococcoidia bacterium]|nr:Rieske 2Fe-2S domain-containing protein [Dehalococcoidia bacterium]